MIRPVNSVFVTIDNIYQDEVVFASGVKLFIPVEFERERHCATKATIHSVPEGFPLPIQKGDTVAIMYNVVGDYTVKNDSITYNRCYTIDDEAVWAADWYLENRHMIMAKLVGEEWQPLGDWCMLEEVNEEIKTELIIPDIAKKKASNKAKWYAGDLPIDKGDIVFFGTGRRQDDPRNLKQLYILPDGREFIFINKDYVLCN